MLRLERRLLDGTWRPGRFVTIELIEPKHRIVSAAPFRDRVVHHALCAVIEPIFERGFIDDVIEPHETRTRLIRSLRTLETKVDTMPKKKHGNIPL